MEKPPVAPASVAKFIVTGVLSVLMLPKAVFELDCKRLRRNSGDSCAGAIAENNLRWHIGGDAHADCAAREAAFRGGEERKTGLSIRNNRRKWKILRPRSGRM